MHNCVCFIEKRAFAVLYFDRSYIFSSFCIVTQRYTVFFVFCIYNNNYQKQSYFKLTLFRTIHFYFVFKMLNVQTV